MNEFLNEFLKETFKNHQKPSILNRFQENCSRRRSSGANTWFSWGHCEASGSREAETARDTKAMKDALLSSCDGHLYQNAFMWKKRDI